MPDLIPLLRPAAGEGAAFLSEEKNGFNRYLGRSAQEYG
jgi:hypothetical protein